MLGPQTRALRTTIIEYYGDVFFSCAAHMTSVYLASVKLLHSSNA